ncbi:GL21442, partial [Drosophila persimilis]
GKEEVPGRTSAGITGRCLQEDATATTGLCEKYLDSRGLQNPLNTAATVHTPLSGQLRAILAYVGPH